VTAILITGGEGVLGWHLAEKFHEAGYKVFTTTKNGERPNYTSRNYTLDIRDRSSFNNLPRDVDIVIHAAAISRVGVAQTNPDLCLKVNVEGTLNLAEWTLSLERPPLLIFLSSREVYGEASYVPVDENHPTNPISVYGKSKLMAENILHDRKKHGLQYIIIRLTNVYGSTRDYPDRAIPSFIINSLKGNPLIIYGGGQILDFLHLEDFLEGILKTVNTFLSDENKVLGLTFNFCSGIGYRLTDVAKLILKKTQSNSVIKVEENRPYETRTFIGDNSKARSLLGINSQVNFDKGITEYIERMRNLINNPL